MSDSENERPTNDVTSPLDPELLDGYTVEQLSDYLDRGRTPRDPEIESSPGAQNALAALARLRALAPRILQSEADARDTTDENWIRRILDQIGVQAHAGRDIPLSHGGETARLSITEGAVRALVREAGDELDGLIVEKTMLRGDIESAGEPVTVEVDVSLFVDADPKALIPALETAISIAIRKHTELNIEAITVRVRASDLDEETANE